MFSAILARFEIVEPLYTARMVSKVEPCVSKTTLPDTVGCHRYQTEFWAGLPESGGSPSSGEDEVPTLLSLRDAGSAEGKTTADWKKSLLVTAPPGALVLLL